MITGGAKRGSPKQGAIAAAGNDFAGRARSATARAAASLKHGIDHARSTPPGKAPHAHAKAATKDSRDAERTARRAHQGHLDAARTHAQHVHEAHEAAPAKQSTAGVHGAIRLKPIADWSKFMPEPLPDQDEHERARIEGLVKRKLEGERGRAAEALDKLRSAHIAQAAAIRASRPRLQAQIAASQQQALGHVSVSERVQAAAVQGHVASEQGQVSGHAAAEKSKLIAAHAAAITRINAMYDAAAKLLDDQKTAATGSVDLSELLAVAGLNVDFIKLKGDFVKLGSKKAGDALAVGEEEAGNMGGRWDGDKLEAAQKAARDTADGFATQMPDQAMATYAQIEQNRPAAEQSLHDLATTTRGNVDQVHTSCKQALDAIKTSSIQAADTARAAAISQIDQASSSTNAALGAQGAAQVAAIHQQGSAARARITHAGAAARAEAAQMAEQTASGLEGGAAGIVRGAAQIDAPDLEDVARTVQKGSADLAQGSEGLVAGLSGTATASSESLTAQASATAGGMASLAQSARSEATRTAAGAKQQIASMAQGAIQAFGQVADSAKTTFDKTTTDAQTAFTAQTTSLDTAYAGAVTERATSFAGNLSQCEGQLDGTVPKRNGGTGGAGSGKKSDEGGGDSGGGAKSEIPAIREAAQTAADAVKPWWQKALAVVVAVVVAIAVVVIVTALVATTGPVGMILVGAAAGALSTVAGTMASNLVLGNKLMEGVTWKSVLIGAVGGALCAGATVGVGAAAKALAGSTRLAASTGMAARGVSVAAKALDTSEGVVGGLQAGAIRYGTNLVTNFAGSELATFAVEGKLDLSLETIVLTVALNKLPGKLEHFQAKVQSKIQSKIPFGFQVKKTTFGNPAKVSGGAGGDAAVPPPPAATHGEPVHSGGAPPASKPSGTSKPASTPSKPGEPSAAPVAGGAPQRPPARPSAPRDGAPAPQHGAEPAGTRNAHGGEPGQPHGSEPGQSHGSEPGQPHGSEPGQPHGSEPGQPHGDGPAGARSNDSARPHDGGGPDSATHRDGADPSKPTNAAPGAPGAPHPDPHPAGGPAHASEDVAAAHGDAPAGAPHGDHAGASGPHAGTEGGGGPAGAEDAHAAAQDSRLDELGYPAGTRAKGGELADQIAQGNPPAKDVVRDTAANQRGVQELQQLLHDPTLSPADKLKVQQDLAARLHGEPEPTGNLSRDLHDVRSKPGDTAAPGARDPAAPHDPAAPADGPIRITSAANPHGRSTFTGKPEGAAPHPQENLRAGNQALHDLAEHHDLNLQKIGDNEYLVTTQGGDTFTVTIESRVLAGDEVAHTDIDVNTGKNTIRISSLADPVHVERAMAHELAEVQDVRARHADARSTGADDALKPGDHAPAELSPHDRGRLAELDVLRRQREAALAENDPAKVADADREIQALVDHLGLRDGTPGADGRLALIEEQGHLPPGTRDLLDANLQRSLDEIRTGTPGHVRSEAELSNADVIRSLQDQLQEIKPAQVDDIIGRFPAADQERARQVLARSSGYGDMESLNSLRAAAEPYLAKGAELYTPGQGSLADNLTYLATEKKVFHDTPGDIAPTREIKQGTVVILDDVVLAKIKSDPAFARSLRDHGAVLLDPRGFAEGNNMFNAGTPDAIARRTARLLDAATEIQARSGGKMSFDDAITAALDRPALETLAAADPALAGQRRVVDPAGHPDTSSEAIAGKLNGDAGISEARLEAALSRVPEADRGYLRELLAQQGEVFSPRRIANSLEAQHQRIMQHAAEHGIAPDKVYYFILEPSKSYDMVAMAHRAVTETPVDHYISGADALAARHLGPDTMLVILDDVAGSGNSLKNKASPAAANTGYPGEIVVSPVVSTTDAVSLFEGRPRPGSNLEGGSPAPYLPEKVIQSLRSSPFYQSLSHADQAELEALVGHLGFDENGLSMAFPYMAPNNNNLFFSDQIAQWFIMNKTRGASKVTKGMDQTWDPDRRP